MPEEQPAAERIEGRYPRSSFRHTALNPRTGPRGLERSKAKGETVGIWELEDKQQLEGVAWLKMRKAAAMEA
ncbi:hypothetical protein [Pontibacter rugosus]